MGMQFTERQQRVVDARGHNILVSAAAGSGKTSVLTARIAEMISDRDNPADIDRLLVVTFTRAAAAQMRERIGKAISDKLLRDPGNRHLQTQEILLQKAQITTIDSFCTYVLRNHFSSIGLDPGFRQMDETEAALLRADVMDVFLEEKFAEADPAFLACAEYFCAGGDDSKLGGMISDLLTQAESHPMPEEWLALHRGDYRCGSREELAELPWMQAWLEETVEIAERIRSDYDRMLELCSVPGGPWPYADFLRQERDEVFLQTATASRDTGAWMPAGMDAVFSFLRHVSSYSFGRMPTVTGKKYPDLGPELKAEVKDLRDRAKEELRNLGGQLSSADPDRILDEMKTVCGPVETLFDLVLAYKEKLTEAKKDRNAIDFSDLEHYALQILTEETEDGRLVPSGPALAFRRHFHEILIDEYQDSNEVQEVLLRTVSGEDEGRFNRFMVGDVKQSIYRFRLARPEIFMEKYSTYRPGDKLLERIDLDQNFRSRPQVLDSVNEIFSRLMRREVGGVDYTDEVTLKPGAAYTMPEGDGTSCPTDADPYRTELLFVSTKETEEEDQAGLSGKQKEASVIAARIKEIVGKFPVSDGSGGFRTASYGDIVILLRSASGWNEEFREVLQQQGIPVHVESRTGYFGAREIQSLLQLLRALLNPRQDLVLYGVMHSYFGGFSEEDAAVIRAFTREGDLYEAVSAYALAGERETLRDQCDRFLRFLEHWRGRMPFLTVAGLLNAILEETGYATYCAALPAGEQRSANLRLLLAQADAYDHMAYAGLFRFLRYIDSILTREIDMGEANTLDEKADVVRIMTIHKSKGLEFPVCFVAGLGKRHSYRGRDSSGTMVVDGDWGVGVDLVDTVERTCAVTVRKNAVVHKIQRDSLGEELRILYVAMTRAKEKLILTMQVATPETTLGKWLGTARSFPQFRRGSGVFPASFLLGSLCFGELVYAAVSAAVQMPAEEIGTDGSPLFVSSVWPVSELIAAQDRENASLYTRSAMLEAAERAAEGASEPASDLLFDGQLADRLREKLDRQYARQDLRDLFMKTSVSELKHRAIEEMAMALTAEEDPAGESAAELFPSGEASPYIPVFARKEKNGGSTDPGMPLTSAAAYGTAVHRFLECLDLRRRQELLERGMKTYADELVRTGRMEPLQAAALPEGRLLRFLRSPLAVRMEKAEKAGLLRREQPFVLGIPADRLRPDFPAGETVMVQGIIDAFFREKEGLVLVDYKTDRVRSGRELVDRYRTQIDFYAEALERITGFPVSEKILYSFSLGEEVTL